MPGLDLTADTWMNVLLIALALVIASAVSLRLSVRDWKEALAIGVLTLPLMPLLATKVFGDVSEFLPPKCSRMDLPARTRSFLPACSAKPFEFKEPK